MRILICDDDRQYSAAIEAAIARWAERQTMAAIHVDTYASSEDMLDSLRNKVVYDIAFSIFSFREK